MTGRVKKHRLIYVGCDSMQSSFIQLCDIIFDIIFDHSHISQHIDTKFTENYEKDTNFIPQKHAMTLKLAESLFRFR